MGGGVLITVENIFCYLKVFLFEKFWSHKARYHLLSKVDEKAIFKMAYLDLSWSFTKSAVNCTFRHRHSTHISFNLTVYIKEYFLKKMKKCPLKYPQLQNSRQKMLNFLHYCLMKG